MQFFNLQKNKEEKSSSKNLKTRGVFKFFGREFPKEGNSGFTLVELLVTIVIFVVITGVVLLNSNRFDSSVLLNNFAYDVALTIKQAQSYGVNVRENINTGFNTSVSGAYGIHFNRLVDSTKFVLFNDTIGGPLSPNTPDQTYEGSFSSCPINDPNSECIQKFSMTKGTNVLRMCAGSNKTECDDGLHEATSLSILFYRPSLEAKIYMNGQSATDLSGQSNSKAYAKITLAAGDGRTVDVVVTSVGQIYVKK